MSSPSERRRALVRTGAFTLGVLLMYALYWGLVLRHADEVGLRGGLVWPPQRLLSERLPLIVADALRLGLRWEVTGALGRIGHRLGWQT